MRAALAAAEEDGRGLEAEVARLTVEQKLLFLELETSRDEVSALHSHAGKDKEAMVEDYQKSLEKIFTYGYGCCVFKHGIRGDRSRIPDVIPDSADLFSPEFFVNLGCPSAPTADKAKAVKVYPVGTTKDLMEGVVAEELG